ncbi:MAG: hypothetical protein HC929_10820 [Leptolyngbyaceae cyanobacterium SM2_5_2]|nr:hypothetical protein [Leptolyngbyaceae cyanobacterium SM2_5_2]
MDNQLVTLQLPANLYQKLQLLATEEETSPADTISRLIINAEQRKAWLQNLAALRQQIQADGGLQLGNQEERVERLQQIRQEIFDTEYAHLY